MPVEITGYDELPEWMLERLRRQAATSEPSSSAALEGDPHTSTDPEPPATP